MKSFVFFQPTSGTSVFLYLHAGRFYFILFYLKGNKSISVGRRQWILPSFLSIPADVLLTVALIQRRDIIVLAAVRRRVAINFRLLPLPVVWHLRNQRTYGGENCPVFLGTPRNLECGKIESQKDIVTSRTVIKVVDLKARASLKRNSGIQEENPLSRFNYSEPS